MTTPLWTFDALVAAAIATPDGAPSAPITGFSIDTRSIQPGDVFVALTDTRDGHDFVTAAFKAGAAAALVRRDYAKRDGDGALFRVDDPLKALERIGIAARARLSPDARVIAVTGSAGKTGTKEMLRACLSPLGNTHAPEKSFNNHWGVPLTLARMPADTKYAVIEIGMNHAGEIRPLTKMTRPHIAIVTNVLPVHIGNFPDGEIGVANAKAEIFEGLEPGGIAIIPRDSAHYERLRAAALHSQSSVPSPLVGEGQGGGESQLPLAPPPPQPSPTRGEGAALQRGLGSSLTVYSFGEDERAHVRARSIEASETGSTITLKHPTPHPDGYEFAMFYSVGSPGRHIAVNSLAVVCVLEALLQKPRTSTEQGSNRLELLPTALAPLADVRAPAGRGARSTITLPNGSILLIDESYNANPASMRAALANLALVPREQHPRRIAVLGDMRELGADAPTHHRDLKGAILASGADLVFACGDYMKGLFDLLPATNQGSWAAKSTELASTVASQLRAGDVVMIKGSLGTNMAPIVSAVRALDVNSRTAKA